MRGSVSSAKGVAALVAALAVAGIGPVVQAAVLDQINEELVAVVQAVRPSVVAVQYPHHLPGVHVRPRTWASGVAVAEDHVVTVGLPWSGRGRKITVTDWKGRKHDAEFVRHDPADDLTLLRVPGAKLKPVKMGKGGPPPEGSFVIALGNPFGLSGSIALGNISGVGRHVTSGGRRRSGLIQFSAPINPGDSGACLANLKGEMVGLVSSSLSSASILGNIAPRLGAGDKGARFQVQVGGSAQSIAFAVPVERVRRAVAAMKKGKTLQRGYLGVFGAPPPPDSLAGAHVARVLPDTPAAKAGIAKGDVITKIGDKTVTDFGELREAVEALAPGTTVAVTVVRDGSQKQLNVTLGRRPDDSVAMPTPMPKEWQERLHPWLQMPQGLWTLGQPPLKLGVQLQDLTPDMRRRLGVPAGKGVMINSVMDGLPAEKAGLVPLDVILKIGPKEVNTVQAALAALAELKHGSDVALELWRDGKAVPVTVRLAGRTLPRTERWQLWHQWPNPMIRPKSPRDPIGELEKQLREMREKMRQLQEQLRRRQKAEPSATQPSRI